MPAGVVIRGLDPLVSNPENATAVVVVDLLGKFFVNLLGGSDENAFRFTRELAKITGGQAVITGFSHESKVPSVDWITGQKGWKLHPNSNPSEAVAAIVNHQPVVLAKDDDLILPSSIMNFSWSEVFSDWQTAAASGYRKMVVLTCRSMNDAFWQNVEDAVVYFLPRLVIGGEFCPHCLGRTNYSGGDDRFAKTCFSS